MSISTTYLLNVALHAAILSVFASLALLAMRQARHRSVTAIAGLLAVGFLPWLTALRPAQPVTAPAAEIQTPEASALPTWTVVTFPFQQDAVPASAKHAAAPAEFAFPDPLATFASIWAAGTAMGLLLLAITSLKVHFWRKSLLPLDAAAWKTLRSLSPETPARHRLLLSETTVSPCVTGIFRPQIVLPRFLMEPGSEEGLRWAVRHEIAHWQAGDSRWMILFALIRCANWWNPLVHRQVTCWAASREQLCDLAATVVSESRADYGEFLIAMARRITKQLPLTVAMAKRLHARRLKRRILCLLDSESDSGKPVGRRFISIGSAVVIAAAVGVSGMRIGAQEPSGSTTTPPEVDTVAEQTAPIPKEETSLPPLPAKPLAETIPDSPAPPAPAGNPAFQVKISTKLVITSTRPVTKNSEVLSNAAFKAYLKSMSQIKGVWLMTAPSVTARFGQAAKIEMIREVMGTSEQIAARGPKSPTPFTGISLESTADLEGNQAKLKFEPRYHFIPGLLQPVENSSPKPSSKLNPEQIKIAKQSITAVLNAGDTLCSDLGEIEPGKFLQVFTTIEPLDGTGRPLDGFMGGKPFPDDSKDEVIRIPAGNLRQTLGIDQPKGPLPSTDVRGKLKLSGMMVELPAKGDGVANEDELRRMVSSTSIEADRMRKAPGAKLRKLKVMEIPLNKSRTPWPEFPGLKVSAIASSDFQLITISSHAVGDGVEGLPNTWQDMRAGSTMIFRLRTRDPLVERCLLFTIEAVK